MGYKGKNDRRKIGKERCGGTLKLSFFQNVDITSVLEKTQP